MILLSRGFDLRCLAPAARPLALALYRPEWCEVPESLADRRSNRGVGWKALRGSPVDRRGDGWQESSLPVPVAIGEVLAMLNPIPVRASLLSTASVWRRLGGEV